MAPSLPVLAPRRSLVPDAPVHLTDLGQQVWEDVWSGLPGPVANVQLDRLTVLRVCEAAEDRAAARKVLTDLGPLLEEPIVTPRGDVVGTRQVANPAAEMLRKLDRELDGMSDRLGMSPAARARLGLTISKAALAGADASSLLARLRQSKESA
jgi:P27 family predicted phage terminase small subunit